jgi:hypothetical protein
MNFVARDGVYTLTFPDGTRLVHTASERDPSGRDAWGAGSL